MSEGHTDLGRRRHAAVPFIFITALMDILALGIMIPVLPMLVMQFSGGAGSTANAAVWTVVFASTWGVMQFIFGPILGMMSDRFGRRPVLLISIFGLGVDFLFMAFAPTIWWLLVGRIINGIAASSFSTANAYIADVTAPQDRAKAFGMLGAAFGVGFTFGPALGGYLGEIDLRLPFLVCAGLALLNWLYGFFILPESLPVERRAKTFDWRKANPFGSFKLLRSHNDLLGLAGVGFLFQLAHVVLPAIFVLYANYRYGWTPFTMGLTLMGTGIANIIVQALLVGPAVKRFGERGTLLIGLLMGATGFLIYALAPTGTIYLIGIPVFALMGLVQPGLQGLMTRRVQAHEQGQLQGANASLAGITAIIGPPLFGLTFAWSVRHDAAVHQPGLAVLIAAALLLAGFLLALKVAKAPVVEPQPA